MALQNLGVVSITGPITQRLKLRLRADLDVISMQNCFSYNLTLKGIRIKVSHPLYMCLIFTSLARKLKMKPKVHILVVAAICHQLQELTLPVSLSFLTIYPGCPSSHFECSCQFSAETFWSSGNIQHISN